jgi:polysaccharide pyruvyl transferase WcaK-like protein
VVRVLVLWADDRSPNLGVRVLARGTADLVRRVHPDAEIVHLHYGRGPAPVPVGDWRRLVKERAKPSSPLRDWLAGFDLAVDTRAGDSFADIYGLRRLMTHSLLAELATQSGTPVVLGPQTIGPFGTRRGRAAGRWSMRRARAVITRDSKSAEYAAHLGRPVDAVATDVVFALGRPAVARDRDVLLNVSGLLWNANPHVDHDRYRTAVVALSRGLLAAGRRVELLAHVLESPAADNDVPAVRAAAELIDDPRVGVLVPQSLDEARSMTASAHLVVGSRMHACLNALSTGTPAVPLAYSRKFEPLLADLGWPHTVDLRSADDPAAAVLALADRTTLQGQVAQVLERAEGLLARATTVLADVR